MKKITIVGGGGHVGLPLGIVLAESGFKVTAYDTSLETVTTINSGSMPFFEIDAQALLTQVQGKNSFNATTDVESIDSADIVIIVIGTPVDEHLSPDPNQVVEIIEQLLPRMRNDQTLILRSTVFPGVSKRIEELIERQLPGLRMAYCPERIVEGNAIAELKTLPQIIGSYKQESYDSAAQIFEGLGVTCIKCLPEEAELAKLFTNVYRYIKFATANQFWMIANDSGVDFARLNEVITFEYPRGEGLPLPGFTAGPCLFKDTMQLSSLIQQKFLLGHAAMLINEGTPNYLVEILSAKYPLQDLTVGILGMTFKGNVDDIRGSLAYKLRKLLKFRCKDVLVTDEYVTNDGFLGFEEVVNRAELLIIGAPHAAYKNLHTEKPTIDIWNLLEKGLKI